MVDKIELILIDRLYSVIIEGNNNLKDLIMLENTYKTVTLSKETVKEFCQHYDKLKNYRDELDNYDYCDKFKKGNAMSVLNSIAKEKDIITEMLFKELGLDVEEMLFKELDVEKFNIEEKSKRKEEDLQRRIRILTKGSKRIDQKA